MIDETPEKDEEEEQKQQREEKKKIPIEYLTILQSLPKLTQNQMEGKNCVVCEAYRAPKSCTIPHIHIGDYRTFMVCKKTHLVFIYTCFVTKSKIYNIGRCQ